MAKQKWELPVAFYFQVKIGNEEFAFHEASGLSTERETETVYEGGVNDYAHLLPKQVKHQNLVLKRALMPLNRNDVVWIKKSLESDLSQPLVTRDIIVSLLGQAGTPLYTWTCSSAYPVKWEIASLDAESNAVLLETLEFAYASLKRS
jgi:phage tail-like protein